MAAFDITSAGVGLLSSVYFFAYTPMQLPVGVLMDHYGPRRILTLAVFCCALGSAFMGMSSLFGLALIGRFLIGFGSAFAFVGVLKLASIWLPPERFAFIAGLTTSLGMVGAMIGQNVMTSMVDELGVKSTLVYACIIGVVLVPLVWMLVKEKAQEGAESFDDFRTLKTDIMLVFSNRQIWLIGMVGACIILPTTVFAELWGGLFFKTKYGYNPSMAATATSMVFLGWAVGGPLAGFISDTLKTRVLPLKIGALIGAAMMAYLIFGPTLSSWQLYGFLFFFGVISSVEIICFAAAKENSPTQVAGTAIAMTNFIVVCAGFFQWFVGKLLDISRADAVNELGYPLYQVKDFEFALMLLPIGMLLGFVLCFFINETQCRQS